MREVLRTGLYDGFDVRSPWPAHLPLKPADGSSAIRMAKKLWRQACGRSWPGIWVPGRGNHRTYPRGQRCFLVNSHQTWRQLVHDMSHSAYAALTQQRYERVYVLRADRYRWCWTTTEKCRDDYATAPKKEHCDDHAMIERAMLATVLAHLEDKR
jgi:hypothetical protein